VFSTLEVYYENVLYKFTSDTDIDKSEFIWLLAKRRRWRKTVSEIGVQWLVRHRGAWSFMSTPSHMMYVHWCLVAGNSIWQVTPR